MAEPSGHRDWDKRLPNLNLNPRAVGADPEGICWLAGQCVGKLKSYSTLLSVTVEGTAPLSSVVSKSVVSTLPARSSFECQEDGELGPATASPGRHLSPVSPDTSTGHHLSTLPS